MSEEYTDKEKQMLETKLLSNGGCQVVLKQSCKEEDSVMCARGHIFDCPIRKIRNKNFRPNHCHDNTAYLYRIRPKIYTICTGWVLDYGCWRRHSWILSKDGAWVFG
jgi:hypothetical protein